MATREQATYCRICEALCGLIATVEDGRLVSVRGDGANPYSQGFLCTKAKAMLDVVYDDERVLRPLRRNAAGRFEPVTWDEALGDISARLKAIVGRYGSTSFASFIGNPPHFGFAAPTALEGFMRAIGSRLRYCINGEDAAARFAAEAILYGSPSCLLKPDFWRTNFALIIGANPLVSKGSMINEPQIRQALQGIVARGGRVVVVDPRRTETAKQFEHLTVQPGGDPWLLVGLLKVIVDEGLADQAFLGRYTRSFDRLTLELGSFTLEECSSRSRVPRAQIEALARDFAAAPSAVVYGRTGTCTQRFGTLNNLLQDLLMIVTGNIERPGGGVFGWAAVDTAAIAKRAGMNTYGAVRTRVRQLPEVFGLLPAQGLAEDITTPGDDRIRAMIMVGGNPVITSGVARDLPAALEELELLVCLDLYVNETNRHADYILPATSFYERADIPLGFLGNMLRPSLFVTDAVIEPRGDARSEEWILNEIAGRMGLGSANPSRAMRLLARLGINVELKVLVDALLRTSPVGDLFGLRRGGYSWRKLATEHPSGVVLKSELPVSDVSKRIETPDGLVDLAPAELISEFARLAQHHDDDRYPLRMIGLREVASHNSWMHNSARLVPENRKPRVRIHPVDAKHAGLADGDLATISSASGTIEMAALVTDEVSPGTVAIPHGWGHHGGWTRANAAGGSNTNLLVSTETADVEPLAGMSILVGIPIQIAKAGPGHG